MFSLDEKISIPIKKPAILKSKLIIDFGTTNTCVAWKDNESSEIKILLFKDEGYYNEYEECPTILFFKDYNKKQILSDKYSYDTIFEGDNFLYSAWGWKKHFDKDIKDTEKYYFDKNGECKKFDILSLTIIYLKNIISKFTEKTGLIPEQFAFTYPANYEDKKSILIEAMKNLNYDEKNIFCDLNEPNSLAYYFAINGNYNFFKKENLQYDKNIVYAIFDFGGGTTDITIAQMRKELVNTSSEIKLPDGTIEILEDEIEEISIEILDTGTPELVGGDYLDFELSVVLKEEIENKNKIKIAYPKDINDLFRNTDKHVRHNVSVLIKDARSKIKHSYNKKEENYKFNGEIYYEHLNKFEKMKLNQTEIEYKKIIQCVEEHVKKGFSFLERMIDDLYKNKIINKPDLDYLFICGNSSRILEVKEKALDLMKKKEEKVVFPSAELKKGVVLGAANYYNTTSEYKLKGLSRLPVYIGNNIDGRFCLLEGDNVQSRRGLNLDKENKFRTKIRSIRNNFEEILYSYNGIIDNKLRIFEITKESLKNININDTDKEKLEEILNIEFTKKELIKELEKLKLEKIKVNILKNCNKIIQNCKEQGVEEDILSNLELTLDEKEDKNDIETLIKESRIDDKVQKVLLKNIDNMSKPNILKFSMKTTVIEIPQELNNNQVFLYIYLNNNFPNIKYQIYHKKENNFVLHSENYIRINI